MLHWYLKLQKLRYDDSFEYSISIEKKNGSLKEIVIPSFVILLVFENIVEQSSINKVIDQHFNVDIKTTEKNVVLEIQYQSKSEDHTDYPKNDYRNEIMKWEDQVELLNTVKGYNIVHNTIGNFNNGMHTKSILLELPNLA